MGDNFVTDFARNRPKMAAFLIDCSMDALLSHKYQELFSPVPHSHWNADGEALELLRNELSADRKSRVNANSIKGHGTDGELLDDVGPIVYGYLRFVFTTNKMMLSEPTDFKLSDALEGKCTIFQVDHNDEAERDFANLASQKAQGRTCFLYHGSGSSNWYSILMNGLKVFSNTGRMTNGAAYGRGVYTSDTCCLSLAYSLQQSSRKDNIIGVFETIGTKELYRKAPNIYVIPDAGLLRMKYLIAIRAPHDLNSILGDLDNLFNGDIFKRRRANLDKHAAMRTRRLTFEIEKVKAIDPKKNGLRFEINEDSKFDRWTAFIGDIDPKTRLFTDMERAGLKEIKLEILFGPSYPFDPPFVRIVRPRFQYRTGHITLGGSICMELLTKQGWSPTYSIETLFVHIKALIVEGGGQLDPNKRDDYSLREAQIAFSRTLDSHGWK